MCNLSPRWTKVIRQTPENVGPSTYMIDESKFIRKNYAPFQSLEKRKSTLGRTNYCNTFYDGEMPKKIIGGSSLKNRSKRDTITMSDTPGPADYDPKFIPKKSPRREPVYVKGKKLYVCRTPYNITDCGPSVPTKIDENGYVTKIIDDRKCLVKVPQDEFDTTLGPAFYDVNTQECLTSRNYRGCAWSSRTGKRGGPAEPETPAPGAYNLDIQKPFNEKDEYVREMARLYSFIPRFIEGQQIKTRKEDLPGPNQYNLVKSLEKKFTGIKPSPFVSGAKRFDYNYGDNPAPDRYRLCDCSTKHKYFSMKQSPFNVDASRFKTKHDLDKPGPATYSIPTQLEQKREKRRTQAGFVPPFNHTAKRTCQLFSNYVATVPSPFNYTIEHFTMTTKLADGSAFRSTTGRSDVPKRQYNAEPASYSISEAFNKNCNRKSYSTGKVPFLALGPRSADGPPGRFNPGPADYIEQPETELRPLSFKISPRWSSNGQATPGPGDYTINLPKIATHNLRFKENILHTKLRLAPAQTRDAWDRELKKAKQMRIFYRPSHINAKVSEMLLAMND